MEKPDFPNPEEIKEIIKKVTEKLEHGIQPEGYNFCLSVLNDRLENPENPYFLAETEKEQEKLNKIFRAQLEGIDKMEKMESRAIAVLCIVWLNGEKDALRFLDY